MSSTTGLKCGECGGYDVELKTTDRWVCVNDHEEKLFPVEMKVCLSCPWQITHHKLDHDQQDQRCKDCGWRLQVEYLRE